MRGNDRQHGRRIVTDPVDGTVVNVGRRRYPSAGLARHVRERDRTCRFPGCSRPARKSDLDHTQRHTDGGGTAEFNLETLCRHHHRLEDEAPTGWTLTQPSPGHLEWTSPTGRVYRVGPPPADLDPPHAPDRPRSGRGGAKVGGDAGSRSPSGHADACSPDTTRQIASRSGGSPGDPPPF